MDTKIYLATYGSLKEGFYNHDYIKQNPEPILKTTITGCMYLNGTYPYLFKTKLEPNGIKIEHELEIYEITKEEKASIDYIEAPEYNKETIDIEIDGKSEKVIIYWTKPERINSVLKYNLSPIKGYTKELLRELFGNKTPAHG